VDVMARGELPLRASCWGFPSLFPVSAGILALYCLRDEWRRSQ
jgi:hypothetical protein